MKGIILQFNKESKDDTILFVFSSFLSCFSILLLSFSLFFLYFLILLFNFSLFFFYFFILLFGFCILFLPFLWSGMVIFILFLTFLWSGRVIFFNFSDFFFFWLFSICLLCVCRRGCRNVRSSFCWMNIGGSCDLFFLFFLRFDYFGSIHSKHFTSINFKNDLNEETFTFAFIKY